MLRKINISLTIAVIIFSAIFTIFAASDYSSEISEKREYGGIKYFDFGKEINDELFNILVKYEEFVRLYENDSYGYEKLLGYPMYLFAYGYMYCDLYNITSSNLFLKKFWRCVNFSLAVRNGDWTWTGYIGYPFKSSLYNFMAYELYIRAYEISGNSTYLNYARNSLLGFTNASFSISHTYNANIFVGCEIVDYIMRFGNESVLYNLARKCFEFSLRGIEGTKWYYTEADLHAKNYYGRSAFYQNLVVTSMMEVSEGIKLLYPKIWSTIGEKLPDMFNLTLNYLTPSHTWFYQDDVLEYTEGAANLICNLAVFDSLYNLNHTSLARNITKFLSEMQCINGAFWRDAYTKDEILLWYTDNVGVEIAEYLNGIGYKRTFSPEAFNYTTFIQNNVSFVENKTFQNHTFLICGNLSMENSTVSFYNITADRIVLKNSTLIAHRIDANKIEGFNSEIICDFINWSTANFSRCIVRCENIIGEKIKSNSTWFYGNFSDEISGEIYDTKINGMNLSILINYTGNFSGEFVIAINFTGRISADFVQFYDSNITVNSNCTLRGKNSSIHAENISIKLEHISDCSLKILNSTIGGDFAYARNCALSIENSSINCWRVHLDGCTLNIKNVHSYTNELLYCKNCQGILEDFYAESIASRGGNLDFINGIVNNYISLLRSSICLENISAKNFGEFMTDFTKIYNSSVSGRKIFLNSLANDSVCIITRNFNISGINAILYIHSCVVNVDNCTGEFYAYYSSIYIYDSNLWGSAFYSSIFSTRSEMNVFSLGGNDLRFLNSTATAWISRVKNIFIDNSTVSIAAWESSDILMRRCFLPTDGFLGMKIDNVTIVNNDFGGIFSLYLLNSTNISIYGNSFYTEDVYDNRNLYWNSSSYGNYWPSWAAIYNDSDGDGIIDKPYPIYGGLAYDYKPLANPVVYEYNTPILFIIPLLLAVLRSLNEHKFQRNP